MTSATLFGVGLTLLAGLLSGTCMLPLKFVRQWRWEQTWLVFSLVSLLLLPWALALSLVSHLGAVYRALPASVLLLPALLGVGWGIAQILFGLSVRRLGLGVAYAIIVGLGAVFGTLVPLFAGDGAQRYTGSLPRILSGVVVMVVGIALTTLGGLLRERSLRQPQPTSPSKRQPVRSNRPAALTESYPAAIAVAVLCGLMAPMLNYAFAFGQGIALEAVLLGNSPLAAPYAVWPVALAGGLLPNLAVCLILLWRNRGWRGLVTARPDALRATLMAVLWMAAFALYGVGAVFLGSLGTSVGWGLFQIFMITTATVSGALAAEWRRAPRSATLLMGFGLLALLASTAMLASGGGRA